MNTRDSHSDREDHDPAMTETAGPRGAFVNGLASRLQRIIDSPLYNTWIGVVPAAMFFWFLMEELYRFGAVFIQIEAADIDARFFAIVFARFSKIAFVSLMITLFLVRKRPVGKAAGVMPRIMALAGTFLMLVIALFPVAEPSLLQSIIGVALVGAGTILSVIALGFLGQSFSIMAEARELVTHGPYAMVRHPLYLAEEIAVLGMIVQLFSIPAVLLLIAHIAVQIQRMKNEEAVLKEAFPEYETYMGRTQRVLPGIY